LYLTRSGNAIERCEIYRRPGAQLWTQVKIVESNGSNQEFITANLSLFDESGCVVALLEGLAVIKTSRKALQRILSKKADLENWLYQITWQPQPREPKPGATGIKEQGSWLIFADKGGIGVELAERLRAQGDRCVLVFPGEIYQQLEPEHYQLNPLKPLDFQRLFQNIVGSEQHPDLGVVHLWSLEETQGNEISINVQNGQALGCGSVLHLVQAVALAGWSGLQHLWLVTRGAQSLGTELSPVQVQQAPLWGLGRVIALEHPEMHCVCLDLEPSTEQNEISTLLAELSSPDREQQIAYRQGDRHVARLVRCESKPPSSQGQLQVPLSQPFQLKISSYGILDNLTLVPMTRRQPRAGEVEIQVRATGLNFRDVLNALGMLQKYSEQLGIESSTEMPFGGECAGTIVAVGENVTNFKVGDEVIAALAIGSFSSFVNVNAEFVALKPQNLSFEEAATIPIAFLTAYYGLHLLGKIKTGDRVLIHAAAGGVGQAAVQLAQRAGAEIFATASPSKWAFLKSIGVEHVMNSRTLDFAEEVMNMTKGQGVNIVFNSLSCEFIDKIVSVLSQNGRFIEIGKLGIWDELQVQEIRPDVSYYPFDLLDISIQNPSAIGELLQKLMSFQQCTPQPLPHKVFPIENVINAFRYMAQAKHIGKVVVSLPSVDDGLDREQVRSDSSYLITGGMGALGLKVADWMVEQGVRHLILTGRNGASTAVRQAIMQWEQTGASVVVAQADMSKREDVARVLDTVQASMPPLRGIVHAAGVLDDGVLLQQNWERFTSVMAPKVEGAWNLHTLTQNLPLDFFVCFSSVAALLGSPGQGNYAAANAFMDALAHHRQALGLPGLSINWGAWADAGMAAQLGSRNQHRIADLGLEPIAPQEGLQVMAKLLTTGAVQVGVMPVNWSKFIQQFPVGAYPALISEFTSPPKGEQPQALKLELLRQFEAAAPGDRHSLLIGYIQEEVAKALGLSASQLDVQQPLNNMGLDSLMAVELKNRVKNELGVDVPLMKLWQGVSTAELAELLLEQLALTSLVPSVPLSPEFSDDMEEIIL